MRKRTLLILNVGFTGCGRESATVYMYMCQYDQNGMQERSGGNEKLQERDPAVQNTRIHCRYDDEKTVCQRQTRIKNHDSAQRCPGHAVWLQMCL